MEMAKPSICRQKPTAMATVAKKQAEANPRTSGLGAICFLPLGMFVTNLIAC